MQLIRAAACLDVAFCALCESQHCQDRETFCISRHICVVQDLACLSASCVLKVDFFSLFIGAPLCWPLLVVSSSGTCFSVTSRNFSTSLVSLSQEVLERTHVSGDFLVSYLHHNYPDFFAELDDVVRASDYLSDADHLTTNWTVSTSTGALCATFDTRFDQSQNTIRRGL